MSGAIVSRAQPYVCAPIDANGNLTTDGAKTYFWNALNQLVEVKEGTTTIATFEYDGAGRRTEKSAAGVTRIYIYDAEDIVEERISGSSTDTIRYHHGVGIDEPLARTNGSSVTTYYLADHLGSIVQETNASGAVTLDREYDAWGVATQGASTSGYAFTGREWDAEISLYYYRARYLNPSSGRFLGDDPLGLFDGPNRYTYTRNRPTIFLDPLGLCSSDGDDPQGQNPLDKVYGELARRQGRSVLDEATEEIARRAQPMGEADTYAELALLAATGGLGKLRSELAKYLFGQDSPLFKRGGKENGGILNRTDAIRIGWGWDQTAGEKGSDVFRIAIGGKSDPNRIHINLYVKQ